MRSVTALALELLRRIARRRLRRARSRSRARRAARVGRPSPAACCFSASCSLRARSASRSCSPARRRTASLPASPCAVLPSSAAIWRWASASCRASSCISPSARRRSSGARRLELLLELAQLLERAVAARARLARDPAGAARSRRSASPRTRRACACCSRPAGCRLDCWPLLRPTGPAALTALLAGLALAAPAAPSRPACRSAAGSTDACWLADCCAICRASSSAFCRSSDWSRVSFSSSRFSSSSLICARLLRQLLLLLQQLVLPAREILDLVERALVRRPRVASEVDALFS